MNAIDAVEVLQCYGIRRFVARMVVLIIFCVIFIEFLFDGIEKILFLYDTLLFSIIFCIHMFCE